MILHASQCKILGQVFDKWPRKPQELPDRAGGGGVLGATAVNCKRDLPETVRSGHEAAGLTHACALHHFSASSMSVKGIIFSNPAMFASRQ